MAKWERLLALFFFFAAWGFTPQAALATDETDEDEQEAPGEKLGGGKGDEGGAEDPGHSRYDAPHGTLGRGRQRCL